MWLTPKAVILYLLTPRPFPPFRFFLTDQNGRIYSFHEIETQSQFKEHLPQWILENGSNGTDAAAQTPQPEITIELGGHGSVRRVCDLRAQNRRG
jgi:hypothetical protein